ncbi:LOW QUALITY PROTEIN: VPS35 endosomal protein-sorting factor-like [Megalobrama amblycephala]|uniref:LOW QUALITY PROTEIN: VPS35 endosomal protein-sorting factor-like n=1 Tax=Megalobrama amblycephala TaxID=75352 RepID=UPI0020141950|nr:LOW QUALITY PROTEIN: VPS35 endosomal protein-sorting factor-like [Megalobrama amblycephala]
MASVQWHSRGRKYESERQACRLEVSAVEFSDYHPLKAITVTDSKSRRSGRKGSTSSSSSSSSSVALDPLSSMLDGTDPLSLFAAASETPTLPHSISAGELGRKRREKEEEVGLDFEPWSSKRGEILSRFTTTEKLSINLFMGSDKSKASSPSSAVSEKVRTRLEELDDLEEGSQRELLNLSQQDYVNRIEELNQSLKEAWGSDQKVKALKIVIQCSKLLSDTSVIQFYPSKFVLITDILDTFGGLVYDRIWSMCADPHPLPESFSADDVNDTAKETCLNWFFKIASIRELVPRLYVEAALLKCNRFLTKSGIQETLQRLTAMIRGIGDPLVAVYARAYLCRSSIISPTVENETVSVPAGPDWHGMERLSNESGLGQWWKSGYTFKFHMVGMEVAPHLKDSLNKNFFDLLASFRQIHGESVQNQLVLQRVEIPIYLTLYSPAIHWILQCVAYRAPEVLLTEMMDRCKKLGNNALLLNSVMWAFRAEFVAARATDFIGMIKDCDEAGFPKHLLFASLGRSLSCADPPESERLSILNEAWKVITKVRSPRDYINCAEIWVEFTCRHFTKREVNTVLADIIKHMTPDRAFEDAYPQLQSVINKILTYFHDFSVLFSMEKFLPFLDMFQKDSVRVEVCKSIMEVFIKHQQEATRDPVILNALLHICKTMHDSVNALTLDDEKRSLALLINGFIRMVSFGRDFEQQLSFCVEARATFCNLEPVIIHLIHTVNQLAMETRRVMKGNHSRKTAAFVRACAAYSFITIPSLTSIFSRLNLYLLSGQVALANQCLSQADAFLKAAVSILPEVPRTISIEGKQRSSEPFLLEFINNFLSTLLVVPDHPEQGVLYLVRGLLNMVQDYTWEDNSDAKVRVYISALPLLAAMSQESYLYTIPKVDSNETLYGGDPKFIAEINKLCETLIGQVLDHLKTLGRDEGVRRQASLAFSLFGCLLAHGDLRNNKLNQLAVNLWNLSHKHGFCETRTSVRTLEYIKHQAQQADMSHLSDMTARLSLQSRA